MALQYITDSKGIVTGVYIPINEWNSIKDKTTINTNKDIFIPDWQKETVFKRKKKYDANPTRALNLASLLEKPRHQIKKTLINPEAKKDIEAIINSLLKKGNNFDELFMEELVKALESIEEDPKKASNNAYKQIKTALLSTLPYMVHFYMDEKTEKIVIFAVCKYVYEHSHVV